MASHTTRRAFKYLKTDADPFKCYLCSKQSGLQIHHVSYYPEETIPVCKTCHSKKIHVSGSLHPDLQPDQSRPPNYEKERREQEKSLSVAATYDCEKCGERWTIANMYCLNKPWDSVRIKLSRSGLEVRPKDAILWCFCCMGNAPPLSDFMN